MTTWSFALGGLIQWAGVVAALGVSVGALVRVAALAGNLKGKQIVDPWAWLLACLVLTYLAALPFHLNALDLLMPYQAGAGWDTPWLLGAALLGIPGGGIAYWLSHRRLPT